MRKTKNIKNFNWNLTKKEYIDYLQNQYGTIADISDSRGNDEIELVKIIVEDIKTGLCYIDKDIKQKITFSTHILKRQQHVFSYCLYLIVEKRPKNEICHELLDFLFDYRSDTLITPIECIVFKSIADLILS